MPGYANNLNKLDAKIVFVIVNDPSILHEWNLLYGHLDIDAVADPLTVFISAILFSLRYFFCFTAEFSTPIPKSDFSIQ
jgi:peroxiredoxin